MGMHICSHSMVRTGFNWALVSGVTLPVINMGTQCQSVEMGDGLRWVLHTIVDREKSEGVFIYTSSPNRAQKQFKKNRTNILGSKISIYTILKLLFVNGKKSICV